MFSVVFEQADLGRQPSKIATVLGRFGMKLREML